MRDKLKDLIDVKSIVTLTLVAVLAVLVIFSAVTGKKLEGDIFLLFSNATTMILTYFFTKKANGTDKE